MTCASVDEMIQHFGENEFAKACEAITQERKLGLLGIYANYLSDGQLKSDLFVHKSKNSKSKLANSYQNLVKLFDA